MQKPQETCLRCKYLLKQITVMEQAKVAELEYFLRN